MRPLIVFSVCACAFAQQYSIATFAGGAPPPTPIAALKASIGDPPRVAVDAVGNVYFSSLHSIFKVDAAGNLTRFAGNGRPGNSGDLGPAASAQLNYPMGMALDSTGALYVADRNANAVRRIFNGVISTVARGLNQPFDVEIDSRGVIYIADTGNDRVVRVGEGGVLVDVAVGVLNRPEGLAIDARDNLYIADTFNGRVRMLGSDGRLSLVAGTGSTGVYGGDGGPAANAALSLPTSLAFDALGSLYIADFGNGRIRKITNGVISTVAGSSNGVPLVENGPAFSTRLEGPTGVAVDGAGNIYFTQGGIGSGSGLAQGDYRIWKIAAEELHSIAGTGAANFAGDGGPAIAAQFDTPTAIALDDQGNFYIADRANQRVRRMDPDGVVTTLMGNGTPGFAVEFGNPAGAVLRWPTGIAADASGYYVADTDNNRIRKVQPGGNVFTYAGNGNASYFGDGGQATRASINHPEGIALDSAGNLYIADTVDNAVRKVTPAGIITTIAGTGATGFAGDGQPATRAALNRPKAVAVDARGNVYVADTGNQRVRRIGTNGIIVTVAGNGSTEFFPGDSAGTSTSLSDPRGVAVDADGNVYISDTGHNRVRKLFPSGAITTIAGRDGTCCYSGDGGLGALGQLNQPAGLLLDSKGALYIADSGNNAIRVLRPLSSNVSIAAVTNAASNLAGPVAPGEIVTLYGSGMDAAKRVTFNGIAAPLLYETTNQVGAVVPYSAGGASAQVVVETLTATSPAFPVQVAQVAPGLFTADGSGAGQALALNQDGSRNSASRMTGAGETLTLYVTGEGQTNPPGVDGRIGAVPLPVPVAPVSVTIGGANAEVQSASGVKDSIAGLMQVTVLVPDRIFGNQPVVVTVGRVASQPGVTVWVR